MSRFSILGADDRTQDNRARFDDYLASSAKWFASELFRDGEISPFRDETTRLRWAPFLASAALGEASAFAGFGPRILEGQDFRTKNWLCLHLLDEAKHADGFASFLKYFYPSRWTDVRLLTPHMELLQYLGEMERCAFHVWLVSTQIVEVFTKHSYLALIETLREDERACRFFQTMIKDEHRHIDSIFDLIRRESDRLGGSRWRDQYFRVLEVRIKAAQRMYSGRRGCTVRQFESMGIDVKEFSSKAETELLLKFGDL